jgi:tRNA nucleotidyltransferase (CCA-adding enzyme)
MPAHYDVNIYEVGGCIRDDLLGIPTKDVDYTVEASDFRYMKRYLENQGFEIFLETPEYFTIRARFPRTWDKFAGRDIKGLTADFVLARKETTYTDGRHPDEVAQGTIFDDLARRDFTVNAIAKDITGHYIDPWQGQQDLKNNLLRAVGDPEDRLHEDALRALRAIRFTITKGFHLDQDLSDALRSEWLPPLLASVSAERRREELTRAFRHDTLATLDALRMAGAVFTEAVFTDGLWLKPTLEK